MAHRTVFSSHAPGIPVFKVVAATLPWFHDCKVGEYRGETALDLLLPLVGRMNFCDLESETVVRIRALRLTPSLYDFLGRE